MRLRGGDLAPARRDLLALLVIVTGILAWFADKAFTVDDPLFLWLGKNIQSKPFDFFGFLVNWNASQLPMHEITQNPPLTGYFIAAAATLLGWSEVALHGAFLLPAAVSAAFTYGLARRFCDRPLEASLIGLLTPAFLVSSTNVMCDTTLLAFWVGSIWCWVRGFDQKQASWWLAAAVLASAAFLTKYFGIALVPLLLAYGVLKDRKLGSWSLFLLLPLASAVGYDRLTEALYGAGQLVSAVGYAAEFRATAHMQLIQQVAIGLVFAGGCLIPALFFAPLLWSRWVLLGATALFALAFFGWSVISPVIDVEFSDPFAANVFEVHRTLWSLVAQFLLFAWAGASVVGLAIADVWRRRDPDSALLALWALGTVVFAAFVNWVNNGRSLLPIAPVLGILVVRRLEAMGGANDALRSAGRRVAFTAGLLVALAVTDADYRWANSVRDVARELVARHRDPERQTLFLGNWGWQYYMDEAGATAVDGDHFPRRGDRLIAARNNTDFRVPGRHLARLLEQKEVSEPRRIRTMTRYVTGFYAHNMGPLPYAFTPPMRDRYYVWEAKTMFRMRPLPLVGFSDPDALAESGPE